MAARISRAHSITTTLDRYGHLFPGSEGEAAVLLDVYLAGEHAVWLPQFLPQGLENADKH